MSLSPTQKRFCEEYLVDGNATAAYRRAGYVTKSPRQDSHRMLQSAEVQAYLQVLRGQSEILSEVSATRVLAELASIAFARLEDVVDVGADGVLTVKPLDKMGANGRAALQSVQNLPGVGVKVVLGNKLQALELLGKYQGLFSDFNGAIATLRKYGLELKQTEAGWEVDDVNSPAA